jgi:hypothetical protein
MTEHPENPAFTQFTPSLRVIIPGQSNGMEPELPHAANCRDPRPWAIVLLRFPVRPHIIRQFRNRQDAEDQLRAMRRLMPQVDFELMFLPPDEADNG